MLKAVEFYSIDITELHLALYFSLQ